MSTYDHARIAADAHRVALENIVGHGLQIRFDRLADLCARYREACDTSDYPDASPPWHQAAARFRAAVDPDDVCAVIDELGERR